MYIYIEMHNYNVNDNLRMHSDTDQTTPNKWLEESKWHAHVVCEEYSLHETNTMQTQWHALTADKQTRPL